MEPRKLELRRSDISKPGYKTNLFDIFVCPKCLHVNMKHLSHGTVEEIYNCYSFGEDPFSNPNRPFDINLWNGECEHSDYVDTKISVIQCDTCQFEFSEATSDLMLSWDSFYDQFEHLRKGKKLMPKEVVKSLRLFPYVF